MAQLRTDLLLSLTDRLTGPIGKAGRALRAAEQQVAAFKRASASGVRQNMIADLQKVGASSSQIDRVTRAWERYRRSAGLAADSSKWTKAQIAQVKVWERANISALKNVNAAQRRGSGASPAAGREDRRRTSMSAAAAAPLRYLAPAAIAYGTARAAKSYAEADRAIKRIGITAEATDAEIATVGKTAYDIAQDVAMPYQKVVQGLDTLVAQGRNLKDSMDFLPAVSRTAAAANAEVEDIAKTADSVGTNFKIAGRDMQRAFDIMTAGGKVGQFELKDMARYLPSMGPAAAAAGFTGEKGLTDLVSMLQVMRKGSGTSEEAAGSMLNIFQKMFSEETTKRFAKFGVDLPKAMDKARKEGRNLVEVFEELTNQAIKGDLSKIPQIINDMEFARGVRALLSYRGEWQKLSSTINKTAPGSVVQDLARVTNDAQGKIDKLSNMWESRLRQLGGLVFDVVNPIDDALKRIERGESSTVNAINRRAKEVVNDHIARQELESGRQNEYDSRREIDARKAMLESQDFDEKLAKYDREMAVAAKLYDWSKPRGKSPYNDQMEDTLGRIKEKRDGLVSARRARDLANIKLIENEAAQKAARTRMGPGMTGTPAPITPGLSSFGFGPHGSNQPQAPGPTTAPLPPPRPDELSKAPKMLERFEQIFQSGVEISASSVAAMKQPSGTQDVRVTNPQPAPNVPVSVSVVVHATTNASAADIGAAAGKQVGAQVKRALEGAFSDAAN